MGLDNLDTHTHKKKKKHARDPATRELKPHNCFKPTVSLASTVTPHKHTADPPSDSEKDRKTKINDFNRRTTRNIMHTGRQLSKYFTETLHSYNLLDLEGNT